MAKHDYSRRDFLKAAGIAASAYGHVLPAQLIATQMPQCHFAQPTLSAINNVVSMSDICLSGPVERSDEGIPIGNGRMGTLVWTKKNRLCMQINHVDLYSHGCRTNSFFEAHNDYCGGCAFFDIVFEEEVFPAAGFRQHLSLYEGVLTIEGKGVNVRIVPSMSEETFAITISTSGGRVHGISAVLRMLRYERKYVGPQTEPFIQHHAVRVKQLSHNATSQLLIDSGRIALAQEFQEDDFLSRSAVAVGVIGAESAAEILNDIEVELKTKTSGERTFILTSAVTYMKSESASSAALQKLEDTMGKGVIQMQDESLAWWKSFWAKGVLELHSADGRADFVQQNYHYYLYLMAATSRGRYPTKFNSMLWSTNGDLRAWGAQHWYTNMSCYYNALHASGHSELMEPMFEMYTKMLPACVRAAEQQWGAKGHYIPETVYFDGIEELPDSIAAEMRMLYLMQKPWKQRSAEFMQYAQNKHLYSSRWNWIAGGQWGHGRYVISERGSGPFGPTSHMFNINAKIAYSYWLRYEYTLDKEWLRDRAYPMLRGTVEFYRTFPNTKKDAQGRYHIDGSNSGEPIFGARDTMEDTSAVHAITSILLRAAKILNLDADMVLIWQEFLAHLPGMPTSDLPDAVVPADYQGPRVFANACKPAVKTDRSPNGWLPDPNTMSICYFDLCKIETDSQERFALAQATFDELMRRYLSGPETVVGGLSVLPLAAASLGRADMIAELLPNQMQALPSENSAAYKKGASLANRLASAEGTQGLSAQHLGRASEALQQALLQSNPPVPGGDPVIHLFPAWPETWNARFTLQARGGFTVAAAINQGVMVDISIQSMAGSSCTMRNPFAGREVRLTRNGKPAEILKGALISFGTEMGEKIIVEQA